MDQVIAFRNGVPSAYSPWGHPDLPGAVYDPTSESGMRWRSTHRKRGGERPDRVVGYVNRNGYFKINRRLGGRWLTYYVHRLVFEMFHGPIPAGYEIDHVDGNRSNNLIENLRLATRSQNKMNMRRPKTNKSNYKGVYDTGRNTNKPWRARITVGGKKVHLGLYATAAEAHAAYRKAAAELFGEFARFE